MKRWERAGRAPFASALLAAALASGALAMAVVLLLGLFVLRERESRARWPLVTWFP